MFLLVGVEFDMREMRLEHVIADFEDDDAADDPKSVDGDSEELEQITPRKREEHQDEKGDRAGFQCNDTAFLPRLFPGHLQEQRHGAQRIHQCEECRETQDRVSC